jgi:hypothetical protein
MSHSGEGGTQRSDEHPVVCARCGTTADEMPLTWTSSVEGGVRRIFCDTCSRENIRAIEGRLDSEWW